MTTVVLAVTLLGAACGKDPSVVKEEALQAGDARLKAGDTASAIIEYRRAVQADPKSGEARRKLGEAYLQMGDGANGIPEMVRAADLLIDDVPLQLRTAQLLMTSGRFDDALARAETLISRNPRNVEALIVRAYALGGLRRLDEAVSELELAIKVDPNSAAAYANLGVIESVKGEKDRSEAAFRRAVAVAPEEARTHLALGHFLLSERKLKEAEAEFKTAVKLEPDSVDANRALAFFYWGTQRPLLAEAPLKLATEKTTNPGGKLLLADYYIAIQRLDDARGLLTELTKDERTYAQATLRLASLGMATDRPAARKLLDGLLAKQPNNADALEAKASLELMDNDLDQALADATAAVKAHPESAQNQYTLGRVYVMQGQGEPARKAFYDALKNNPRFAFAEVELARLYLVEGNYQEAERLALSAIRKVIGIAEAHLLLAQVYMRSGRPERAEPSLNLLAKGLPNSPVVQAQIGHMQLQRGNLSAAKSAYERALAAAPNYLDAIAGLAEIDFAEKRPEAALARIDRALRDDAKNSRLEMLAGVTRTRLNDIAGAEAHLKKAIQLEPNNIEAYLALARAYGKAGRLAEAVTQVDALADKQPNSPQAQTFAGILNHYAGNLPAAKSRYEKALAIDPDFPIAANNLAYMLIEDENPQKAAENLDTAMQLAQRAKAKLPNLHTINDTLGWIQVKKEMWPSAVANLRAAVAQQPNNATYHYHLGMAYVGSNDRTNARASLTKALELDPKFDGAEEARKALQSLGR